MKMQSFAIITIILVVSITLAVFLAFMPKMNAIISTSSRAAAADVITPTIATVEPSSALNDLDTVIVITGTGFTAELSGTQVLSSTTAFLGNTALMNMTWVNSTTLTATVPWGLDSGIYTITVVNPDGGTGSLNNAFTVTQGIDQWNGGDLFGGEVTQIMMKPGDPNTLYAPSNGIIGLFRSQDSGEHWVYINDQVSISNGKFAIDPLHPGWIYGFTSHGLELSKDEGVTWTTVMPNIWPDGRDIRFPQVYVSPYDPEVLLVGSHESYGDPNASGAMGLIKSVDGGVSWQIVTDMEGIPAQDVIFHPTDPLKMVLATSDAQVFQSIDGGDTWSEVTKPPMSTLGSGGVIAYNPYLPGEVWIASMVPGAIYKSTDENFTAWQNVTPPDGMGSTVIKFTNVNSVYTTRHHSDDGGLHWQWFGPIGGYGDMVFDPNNPQIVYIGDYTYGVQKSTDGGQTWEIKNQGLTGMRCSSMSVSQVNPLRVYATFGDWMGIYRSTDGATDWTYIPITNSVHVESVIEDPTNPRRLYVESHSNIYVSTDGGESWSDLGWNAPPADPGMLLRMAADPFNAGHLLTSMVYGLYGIGTSQLYRSSDFGVSWQPITMTQEMAWPTAITYDPETPGLVYLATNGTGVYRSTDGGENWERIDDLQQPDMLYGGKITIATHPQHILLVGTSPFRSFDGGTTWERAESLPDFPTHFVFVDRDSTRLYLGTGIGLFLSSDAGDSWTRAAGALGHSQILALDYGVAEDHIILYAATSGGTTGAPNSMVMDTPKESIAIENNLVEAGIYRYVLHPMQLFLPLIAR